MQADHLATEARKRTIAPLEGVAAALNLRADDFLETAWQLGFCNGVRYGIPLDVHALAMFCNSQQLARAGIKEPPSDASTFDDACRGLQEVGFAEPCWIPNGFPALQIFLSLLWQNGGEVYNADFTEANFSSDEAVQALMWMVDQKTKGYSPALVQRDAHWQAFTGRGHTNTIEMNGIWQIPAADKAGLNYKVAPMPTIGTRKALWANSHQIFVSREAARHPHRLKACQVFIDFLSRQSSAWAAAGMIPARKTERQVAMYTESKQHALEPFLGDMRFPPPDRPGLAGITSSTLGATVMRTVSPQVSVHDARDALKQAAARANIKLKNMT
jgi:multiple sugar transport system substrate-binding protein